MKKALTFFIAMAMALSPLSTAMADGVDTGALDGFMQQALQAAHIPGAAVAVVSPDEVLFSKAYGNAASADSPFIIGSMTKSFTALAIMQLVEQGKVGLDTTLSDYPHPGIPPKFISDRLTIRHLLNQSSGLRDYHAPQVKSMETQGDFYYSNANYALLGMVVEVASGQSYGEYIQQHIFDPIGMQNSYTSRQRAMDSGLVQGYSNYFGIQLPADVSWPDYQLAAGYLAVSANDMAKYLQMYMNGGTYNGNYIISPESIEQMWQQGATTAEPSVPGDLSRYGMGWFIDEIDGVSVVMHGGNVETYSANMMIVPDKQLAYVVLFNSDDMLVAMQNDVIKGLNAFVMGKNDVQTLSASAYWRSHLLLDAAILIFLIACSLPLILIRRFKSRAAGGQMNRGRKLLGLLLHIGLPALIIIAIMSMPYPLDIMLGFAPDIVIVAFAGAAILVLTGVYKLFIALRKKKGSTDHS